MFNEHITEAFSFSQFMKKAGQIAGILPEINALCENNLNHAVSVANQDRNRLISDLTMKTEKLREDYEKALHSDPLIRLLALMQEAENCIEKVRFELEQFSIETHLFSVTQDAVLQYYVQTPDLNSFQIPDQVSDLVSTAQDIIRKTAAFNTEIANLRAEYDRINRDHGFLNSAKTITRSRSLGEFVDGFYSNLRQGGDQKLEIASQCDRIDREICYLWYVMKTIREKFSNIYKQAQARLDQYKIPWEASYKSLEMAQQTPISATVSKEQIAMQKQQLVQRLSVVIAPETLANSIKYLNEILKRPMPIHAADSCKDGLYNCYYFPESFAGSALHLPSDVKAALNDYFKPFCNQAGACLFPAFSTREDPASFFLLNESDIDVQAFITNFLLSHMHFVFAGNMTIHASDNLKNHPLLKMFFSAAGKKGFVQGGFIEKKEDFQVHAHFLCTKNDTDLSVFILEQPSDEDLIAFENALLTLPATVRKRVICLIFTKSERITRLNEINNRACLYRSAYIGKILSKNLLEIAIKQGQLPVFNNIWIPEMQGTQNLESYLDQCFQNKRL